jgi:hypothetical protein
MDSITYVGRQDFDTGQNSVRRRNPHRDAGTRKKAEREDRRADNHSGHRPLAATAKSRFIVASLSAVSGGVITESGHNRLPVDDDHGDGAGRQNEGDCRKSNELVHNLLPWKLAGSNVTGTAIRKT